MSFLPQIAQHIPTVANALLTYVVAAGVIQGGSITLNNTFND